MVFLHVYCAINILYLSSFLKTMQEYYIDQNKEIMVCVCVCVSYGLVHTCSGKECQSLSSGTIYKTHKCQLT